MPTWLIAVLLGLPSVIQMLSGKDQQTATQETTATTTPSGYQSPTLGLMDLLMQGTLGKNLGMYGGAGMPGGQSIAPDFLQDFLSLIGSNYYDLQKKYEPGKRISQEEMERRREERYQREGQYRGRGRSYGNFSGQ